MFVCRSVFLTFFLSSDSLCSANNSVRLFLIWALSFPLFYLSAWDRYNSQNINKSYKICLGSHIVPQEHNKNSLQEERLERTHRLLTTGNDKTKMSNIKSMPTQLCCFSVHPHLSCRGGIKDVLFEEGLSSSWTSRLCLDLYHKWTTLNTRLHLTVKCSLKGDISVYYSVQIMQMMV